MIEVQGVDQLVALSKALKDAGERGCSGSCRVA